MFIPDPDIKTLREKFGSITPDILKTICPPLAGVKGVDHSCENLYLKVVVMPNRKQ